MKSFAFAVINCILSIGVLWWIFPSVNVADWTTLVGAGLVLAVLQMFVRPVLKLLLLPINIITLGFFSWIVNVFIVWLATVLVPGFEIEPTIFLGFRLGEFGSLILISFMLSLSQTFVGIFIK